MEAGDRLQQAIELSQQILQAIEREQWDDIAELDQQRSELIKQHFNTSSTVDKPKTRQLKQLNDEIVSRLIAVQQKNRAQQMSLSRSQKASKAYLDNA